MILTQYYIINVKETANRGFLYLRNDEIMFFFFFKMNNIKENDIQMSNI